MNVVFCRSHAIVLLVALIVALNAVLAGATAIPAIVLAVTGPVSVRSGSTTAPATTGMALKAGDSLHSTGGTVTLLMASGQTRSLGKGESFTVAQTQGASDSLAGRLVATLAETAQAGQGPTVKGMVRGETTIDPVFPFNTAVRSRDFSFSWTAPQGLAEARLTVKAASPAYQHVFPVAAGQSSVALPADAPPLQAGTRYYWKLEGMDPLDGKTLSSTLGWLALIGSDQAAGLDADLAQIDRMADIDPLSRNLLKANRLIAGELYGDAAALLKAVLADRPEDSGIKALLKGVYLKMNNPSEAVKIQ